MTRLPTLLLFLLLSACGCTAEVVPDRDADVGDAEAPTDDAAPRPDAGTPPSDAETPSDDAEPTPDSSTPPSDAEPDLCDEGSRSWAVETTTCDAFGIAPLGARTTIAMRGARCELDVVGTADCGGGSTDDSDRSTQTWLGDRTEFSIMLNWCGGDFRTLSCAVRLDALDRLVLSCAGAETCSITLVEDTRS